MATMGSWTLSKLHVKGFKSIGQSQVTALFPRGLCCIVGPNGSGKSNLLDAISFVCGCSANTLGVQRLSDLQCTDEQGVCACIPPHPHILCIISLHTETWRVYTHQVCEVSAEVSSSLDGRKHTVLCTLTPSSGRTYKLNGKLSTGTEIKVHSPSHKWLTGCCGLMTNRFDA